MTTIRSRLLIVLLASSCASTTFAQATPSAQTAPPPTTQAPVIAAPGEQVRSLTIDDAVRLAMENNLGIQVAKVNPQIQDLAVALAKTAWVPTGTSVLQAANADTPNNSFLSGAGVTTTNGRLESNIGVTQQTPWGGSYSVGWDSVRGTTNNIFSNFSPQLNSTVSLDLRQPLLRNFRIDSLREQVLLSQKDREISDVDLQQTIVTTSRTVRDAYWDLAFANASLMVQQESLDLANQSLRETNARIRIGTTPPIDAVEAEAEVALRDEAVIVAQAQIDNAQDALRVLIFNQSSPDFWTTRIVPSDLPAFQPVRVDIDAAVRNALQMRTDLQEARKSLEANDITIRYFRNQSLPDVTAQFDYGLTGLGGTQFTRGAGFPGPIIGQTDRSFASVLGDLFGNQFPSWTLGLNVSYPLGRSQQQASLARAQLQVSQAQIQLRNAELQVVTQVRGVARQVQTNAKRVDATRAARMLNEQRLDAEQKKLAAGTSTNFIVFQTQRDLAQARNDELSAILDYNRSLVDLETIQQVPLQGAGAIAAVPNAVTGATTTTTTTGATTTTTAATTTGTTQ